jgi:hypothetical protein
MRRLVSHYVKSVFHQNVQSLKNKVLEVDVLLQTELSYVNVLCFTEHWQKEQQIVYMNFMQFKLPNSFCRGMYLCKNEGKNFEMAVIELSEYKIIVIFIYRSPDGNFKEFLRKLKLVIQKLSMKGRHFI